MSIEGAIVGLFMIMSGEVDPLTTVRFANRVHQKTEQGTWDDSWHEESHTLMKNMIRGTETGYWNSSSYNRRSALD